jgi:hypothetical protein
MRTVVAVVAGGLLAGSTLVAQDVSPNVPISPNAPKYVKSVKAPGLEIRFLDFRWDETAFAAMEKGGSHPAAQRSWVLARLMLQTDPYKWQGKLIPVGPALLVLNPSRGGAPATLDIRYIDMREVFVDMNVIAEPPATETYQKMPAVFQKVPTVAGNLELGLQEKPAGYDITVHYGDRQATVTLDR